MSLSNDLISPFCQPHSQTENCCFGVWDKAYPRIEAYVQMEECHFVEHSGWGELFISNDGGQNWQSPQGGLQANCIFINDVDVFLQDETVVWRVELTGKGWYESFDKGHLWQPSLNQGNGVEGAFKNIDRFSYYGSRIRLSNRLSLEEYEQLGGDLSTVPVNLSESKVFFVEIDDILFLPFDKQIFRSDDRGETWVEVLNSGLFFDNFVYQGDTIFLQVGWGLSEEIKNTVYRSLDAGETWEQLHFLGEPVVTAVAISPQFDQDQTIFVGTIDGQVLKFNGLTLEPIP